MVKSQEEEKREEADDDDAVPCPPELIIAASYEAIDNVAREAKKTSLELIEDGTDHTQVPEESIALSYEGEDNTRSFMQDIGRLHEINHDKPLGTMKNREVCLDVVI
jgi:hypothetical protein